MFTFTKNNNAYVSKTSQGFGVFVDGVLIYSTNEASANMAVALINLGFKEEDNCFYIFRNEYVELWVHYCEVIFTVNGSCKEEESEAKPMASLGKALKVWRALLKELPKGTQFYCEPFAYDNWGEKRKNYFRKLGFEEVEGEGKMYLTK